jgi:GTP-binding protein HflX
MTRSTSDKLIEIPQRPVVERAILVRLALPEDTAREVDESLEELRALAWTAGAETVLTTVQRRDTPHGGTHIGAGKIESLKAAIEELGAEVVIFDSELSPRQGSNLEEMLGCKVVDRTQLILDIFAQRAQTREGKYQVELAQLQYLLPRLAGRGSIMRQQGGIGVRGPGEQKLELDRRLIREKIARLKDELEHVRAHRKVQRKKRSEQASGQVALVGYTNAGKSSLLNALSHAGVLAEDKLFATLDPRVRQLTLPRGRQIVLADTVGFIRRLPHMLVAAFRATLEEVNESALLLHVIDASHPAMRDHVRAVQQVLEEIGANDIPMLKVYNKSDCLDPDYIDQLRNGRDPAVVVSARTGAGLDDLLRAVDDHLAVTATRVTLRIPQAQSALAARVHALGRVLDTRYEDDCIVLDAEIEAPLRGQLADYLVPAP